MTDPLVSAQWLAAHPGDGLCVLDIRSAVDGGGAAAYEAAHVPGAVHTDYVKDGWRATKGMATGLLPDPAHLADLFARCGITPAIHVVVVGAGTSPGDFSAAARVY
ncbi:MAG: rhodanese-like domain-containing protein, partial [Xanthobacteraceae bacterium]